MKRGDQAGKVQPGERLHGAEHQPSGGQAREGGDLLPRGVHLRQGAASPQEKISPASVGRTPLRERSNNSTPSSCSRSLTWCESAGWATGTAAAALVKCRWVATATV